MALGIGLNLRHLVNGRVLLHELHAWKPSKHVVAFLSMRHSPDCHALLTNTGRRQAPVLIYRPQYRVVDAFISAGRKLHQGALDMLLLPSIQRGRNHLVAVPTYFLETHVAEHPVDWKLQACLPLDVIERL